MSTDIKPYISPTGQRFTEFKTEFQDGSVKPSYLLTDVEKLLGREYDAYQLAQIGLSHGVNFLVKNASDLPEGVQDLNVLGAANGKRTVISLDGVIKLIMAERNSYGDQVREWLSVIVVPKALRAYPTLTDDPTLTMLRSDVNRMGMSIRDQAQELDLVEVKGNHHDLTDVQVKTNFFQDNKTEILIGVAVVTVVTAAIVYIMHRRKNKKIQTDK